MDAKVQAALETKELKHAKMGLFWGVISGMTWGLDGVILGMAFAFAPFTNGASLYAAPLANAAMHDGFAAFWIFLYNLMTGRFKEYGRSLATRPGKLVMIAALFGGPLAMSGYLLGVSMAEPAYALAITAMYPGVGAILSVFVLKEKIVPRVWAGIVLTLIGAVVVGYAPPSGDAYPHFYLGLGLSALACIGWGTEGVISTFGMDMVDSDVAIGIREATSFFVYMIAVLPFLGGLGYSIFFGAFATQALFYMAIAGFFGGLSYVCWYRALNMTGVGRAMALNVTYALWAVFFGWLLTGSAITMNLIMGCVIITVGTILVVANPKELLDLRAK